MCTAPNKREEKRAYRLKAERRECGMRTGLEYDTGLEDALPGLASHIARLPLLAGFLQAFLRRVAHIIALVDVAEIDG